MVDKSHYTHGTLSVYLLCRLLTVSCFQKSRFGEIVNSGSQSNSKVQSTLSAVLINLQVKVMVPFARHLCCNVEHINALQFQNFKHVTAHEQDIRIKM